MNSVGVIAELTFREAARRRIALAGFIMALGFLLIYSIGYHFIYIELVNQSDAMIERSAPGIYNFLFVAGMYAINFLMVAMSALITVDTLSGEINSGAIQSIATKPLSRSSIVLGKWMGYAGLIALYLFLLAGGITLSIWLQSGYVAPNVPRALALMYLESLVVMTIALACSSSLSTLASGGVVFGLFGLAFIGGWVEQIGALLNNETAVQIGIASSLLIPSEALWRRAAYELTTPLARLAGASPFISSSVPSPAMVFYAIVYLLAALVFTLRKLTRRDL